MLNVVMLNVANNPSLLSVIMLKVVMLSVVAPDSVYEELSKLFQLVVTVYVSMQ